MRVKLRDHLRMLAMVQGVLCVTPFVTDGRFCLTGDECQDLGFIANPGCLQNPGYLARWAQQPLALALVCQVTTTCAPHCMSQQQLARLRWCVQGGWGWGCCRWCASSCCYELGVSVGACRVYPCLRCPTQRPCAPCGVFGRDSASGEAWAGFAVRGGPGRGGAWLGRGLL